MNWPAQSIDLNPIENLWAIVKWRLKDDNKTLAKRNNNFDCKIWNRDEEIHATCKRLVDSMPRRVASVIENRGGHTKY